TPVALPPGWLKLDVKPWATGSPPMAKTIGMVDVAALAASAAGSPPVEARIVTGRERVPPPSREAGRTDRGPIDTRSSRSGPPRSHVRPGPGEGPRRDAAYRPAIDH